MFSDFETHLQQMVRFTTQRLRIRETSVYFKSDSEFHERESANAEVEVDPAYKQAFITFGEHYENPEDLFRSVVHELVHVKMAPIQGFWQALRRGLDKPARKMAEEMYVQAAEQTTVGFEQVLVDLLWEEYRDEYLDEGELDDAGGVPEPERSLTVN